VGTPTEATNYRVDRVFAPAPRIRDSAQVAAEILERTRPRQSTPPATTPVTAAEGELTLRRELSRLQRQLSEAQRELANKDDELATEVEKRLADLAVQEARSEQVRELQARVDELAAYEARTKGVEARLQDQIAAADELAQAIEKEHARTQTAETRVDELTRAFDQTRALWSAERSLLEERARAEIDAAEAKRKAQAESTEEALATTTARLRDAHDGEVAELRSAHERALAALRGELVPKALEAHNLAEERVRLASEIAALKVEATRVGAERDELHARELQQALESHATEQAQLARTHAAELARTITEKDEQLIALQQEVRMAEVKQKSFDDAVEGLRESLKQAQRELAESREKTNGLEADKITLQDRLIASGEAADRILEEQRSLREQIEASESEVRRAGMDRMRFVAYLEEGLALLGALPPAEQAAPASEAPPAPAERGGARLAEPTPEDDFF